MLRMISLITGLLAFLTASWDRIRDWLMTQVERALVRETASMSFCSKNVITIDFCSWYRTRSASLVTTSVLMVPGIRSFEKKNNSFSSTSKRKYNENNFFKNEFFLPSFSAPKQTYITSEFPLVVKHSKH